MHFHVFEMADMLTVIDFIESWCENLTQFIIQKCIIQIFFLLSKHMLEVPWIFKGYIMLMLGAKISAVKFLIR